VLPLSAKDPTALRQLALRMAQRLGAAHDAELGDIAFTAATGRAHFAHRVAVTGTSAQALREQLELFAREQPAADAHSGQLKPGARALVGLVFGDAPLRAGALRALAAEHPPLRQALDACDHFVRGELELPPSELLCREPTPRAAELLSRPSHAHAALVSLQYALHTVFTAWGVDPIAVYGAGAGEYAAAAATGVMTWREAIVLATRRGRVLEGLVSGAERAVTVRAFKADLAAVDYLAPRVPFVSAALGRAFTLDELPDEAHWLAQLYHEPRAHDARDAWLAEGCALHLELGPEGAFDARGHVAPAAWLCCADDDAWRSVLSAVAALYAAGAAIDWRAFDAPYPRAKVSLPSYPFQRQRHWLDFPAQRADGAPPAPEEPRVIEQRAAAHPLISRVRVHAPAPAESGFVAKPAATVTPPDASAPATRDGRIAGGNADR
jgi:acyl transferase domain-containing protein